MAKKTVKPPAIKQQQIKEYAWMTDFSWLRLEDDINTEKSGISAETQAHCQAQVMLGD